MIVTVLLLSVIGSVTNVLSAIVWLRPHIVANNSSAVYLAAIAINDIIYLSMHVPLIFLDCASYTTVLWTCIIVLFVDYSAVCFEGLLVLAFSIERLYSICRALKVRFLLSCFFIARQHICYSALYVIARPSVRLSHGWISQRGLKLGSCNLQHRVDSSFLTLNLIAKFQREDRQRGRRMTQG